ncbi:MAG: tryptophan-rich sensory protein [Syntrophomonadaceae bacterium]|nr:tryptophan-rich sensory protein [Syntrophomonadaceae bacterium]
MEQSNTSTIVKISVLITYLAMVFVNALANILPINGVNTGQVSDSYPNLFAPTALTFAIWGLIYLLLACFTVYQLGFFQKDKNKIKGELLNKVGILFSISSIANILWIFSWHYRIIPLSMLLMLVILICLIFIISLMKKETLTATEKIFVRMPFSIYFGWITVATIANATVLLVSLNWNGFGIPEQAWTVIILLVGMLIGVSTTLKNNDVAYGLVIIWAYIGILIKHLSKDGFAFQYPTVVYTVISCIALVVITLIYIMIKAHQYKKQNTTTF